MRSCKCHLAKTLGKILFFGHLWHTGFNLCPRLPLSGQLFGFYAFISHRPLSSGQYCAAYPASVRALHCPRGGFQICHADCATQCCASTADASTDASNDLHARLVLPSLSNCPFHPLRETAHNELRAANPVQSLITSSRLGPPATG